jgi:hypothetical protein
MPILVEKLFEGPVDVAGDVHGEIDALLMLMGHPGYDETGHHPAGRRLVFVGDLTDRGPDSPAVVDLVTDLLASKRSVSAVFRKTHPTTFAFLIGIG